MEDLGPSSKRRKVSHDVVGCDGLRMSSSADDVHAQDTSEQNGDVTNTTAAINTSTSATVGIASEAADTTTQPLSKSQLKKLRKKQEWEAGREFRKTKRKEKIRDRKAKKREEKHQAAEERRALGLNPRVDSKIIHRKPIRLPVTILIDCGFDDKMTDNERTSLGSQLTRAYSDNSKAPFQAHLYFSSWGGKLKERFDTVLSQHYKNWKGVEFRSEDFVHAAEAAKEDMKIAKQDRFAGIFTRHDPKVPLHSETSPQIAGEGQPSALDEAANTTHPMTTPSTSSLRTKLQEEGEVIYLTSDSPYTLSELKPYSTYIIGGLVDKNRHKGICYKTASDHRVKTAKLPIGQYMEMQSRYVLATNHVVEIMVRYLECGDWGEAFMKVIPKRKGGKLKGQQHQQDDDDSDAVSSQGNEAVDHDDQDDQDDQDDADSTHESEDEPRDNANGEELGLVSKEQ